MLGKKDGYHNSSVCMNIHVDTTTCMYMRYTYVTCPIQFCLVVVANCSMGKAYVIFVQGFRPDFVETCAGSGGTL